ncbi:MAG: hypothetical protein ACOCYP_10365 [Planctomycetota bacterium]
MLSLEGRAEFLRCYCQVYPHAHPVSPSAWCNALLADWYRERGSTGLPRELAFLAVESHPDCPMHPVQSCGCSRDAAWRRLTGSARDSSLAHRVLVAAVVRDIRESEDTGRISHGFRALGSLVSILDRSDPEQLLVRNACQRVYARWSAVASADAADPRYAAVRADAQRLLAHAEWEVHIPPAAPRSPSVSQEHYVCFHHRLIEDVKTLYCQAFACPLSAADVFTSYLLGYDDSFLGYIMAQAGKYAQDPRAIDRDTVRPWQPFTADWRELLAARVGACMRWVIDGPTPGVAEVERLVGALVALPAYAPA